MSLILINVVNIFFSVIALLTYNSHTIKFTFLYCAIYCFLVYSQSCETLPFSNFRTFKSPTKITHPNENSCPLAVTPYPNSPYPYSPSLIQPLINLFSVSTDLPVLDILYNMFFWLLLSLSTMFSRFIRVKHISIYH